MWENGGKIPCKNEKIKRGNMKEKYGKIQNKREKKVKTKENYKIRGKK